MFDYSMNDKTWIFPCQVGFTGRKFENSKRNAFTLFFGQALFTILICCVMLSCGKSSLAFLFQRFQLASAYQLIDSSCCCMNFSISWRDHLYFFINSSGGFSSNFLVSLCFDVRILLLFLSLDISWCLLTWHWL